MSVEILSPRAAPVAAAGLAIDDIEPSSVVYGTSRVTLTITGSGFTREARVLFGGAAYDAEVDVSGGRLTVKLPTRRLTIGPHPISVMDASGGTATVRRGLVVY